jgi:UDP-glucuronate 4-epimerase
MIILVTGSAGFIGSSLVEKLLKKKHKVIGIDNLNSYYDPNLKKARLKLFINNKNYKHYKIDISNTKKLEIIFNKHLPNIVIHLAAQAGVRYSIKKPKIYIKSNIVGFLNILEESKKHKIKHLIYASTSSVYGANSKLPFDTKHSTDHPLNIYAATKKSNELMAHVYSFLFNLPTTGLRFFTVYGPWGRPDMSLFKFTKKILNKKLINIFNYGKHTRAFTYIDDIIFSILKVIKKVPKKNEKYNHNKPLPNSSSAPWRIYNIGSRSSVKLFDYISEIENQLKIKAKKFYMPLQAGDVPNTSAEMGDFVKNFKYKNKINYKKGVNFFIKWYKKYYQL